MEPPTSSAHDGAPLLGIVAKGLMSKKRGPRAKADLLRRKARDKMFCRKVINIKKGLIPTDEEGQNFIKKYETTFSSKEFGTS